MIYIKNFDRNKTPWGLILALIGVAIALIELTDFPENFRWIVIITTFVLILFIILSNMTNRIERNTLANNKLEERFKMSKELESVRRELENIRVDIKELQRKVFKK